MMTTSHRRETARDRRAKYMVSPPPQRPFNTWYDSSLLSQWSSSGVSSGDYCNTGTIASGDSNIMMSGRRNNDRCLGAEEADAHKEYVRARRQDLSWYQALRTDESWLRLRKDHEERQIIGSIEWVNQKLSRSWPGYANRVDAQYPVRSLKDMHDGVLMICLLETLYDCELKKELKCRMRLHKLRNYDSCLSFMRTKRRCECVGIQPFDLIDCANVKIMLGFLFLIKHDYEYKYLDEMIEGMRMSAEMAAAVIENTATTTTTIVEATSTNISDEDEQSDDDYRHADQLEVQSLKAISTTKMDDSGLNIGMDTGDETTSMAGGVLSSNIGSASNVQDEHDTYFFETSSDSFSLANHQKKSQNESGNLNNDHTNLSTASSLSSSGSISEELIAAEMSSAPRIDHIEILVTKDSRRISLTDDHYLDNSIDYDDAEDEEEDDDGEEGDFMSESRSEECLKVELVHRHDEPVEAEVKKCLSGDEMCMTAAQVAVMSVYENGERECEEVRDERTCDFDSSTSSSSSFSSTELEKTQILDQTMATGECCSFESNRELNDKNAVEEIDDEKLNESNNKAKDDHVDANQAELEAKPDKNAEIINTLEETPKQETELPTIETISPPNPHLAKTDDIPKKSAAASPIKREPIPIERESPIETEFKPTTDELRLEESKQPIILKLNVIPAVEKKPRRNYKHQQKTDKIVTNDHTAAAASIAPIAVIEQLPPNELVVVEAKLKKETTLFSDVVKNETSEKKKKPVEVVVAEKREIIDKKDEKISSKHNKSQEKPTTSSMSKTVKTVESKVVEIKEEVGVTKKQEKKTDKKPKPAQEETKIEETSKIVHRNGSTVASSDDKSNSTSAQKSNKKMKISALNNKPTKSNDDNLPNGKSVKQNGHTNHHSHVTDTKAILGRRRYNYLISISMLIVLILSILYLCNYLN